MFSTKKAFLAFLFLGVTISLQAQSTDTFDLDETYTVDEAGTISFNSDDAEVTVIGSNRPDVHIVIHYKLEVTGFSFGSRNKFDMHVREQNGDLVIEEQPRDFNGITFGSTDEEYTIRIETPRNISLNLDGDDENYTIREIDGPIAIDADDAKARLYTCKGNRFYFDMDDGTIEMDEGRGSLTIDVDDGRADIHSGRFDEITVDSDDGDFDISTSLRDGGSYAFDMDDGNLVFNVTEGGGVFSIQHDNADISVDSAYRQTVDEEHEAKYELPGGSASVTIDVDDANIELGHN